MIDPAEESMVRRLAAEGLINRRARFRPALSLAVAALLIGVFWLGTMWPTREPDAQPAGPRYVLLLYEGPDYRPTASGRAAEYSAWARAPHADGRVVGGEELAGEPTRLGPAFTGPIPAGFFIVEAGDRAALLRLAASCPHLRHGGSIAIRALTG
ncbi:MAG: hypothetical protein JO276_11895 [Sphingomonadaceae bacterium]|nr:hypothetical protein [Sphingomonadaceae bacterium]